jgi:myo-inositol-1(or 4)-monophosphatase
VAEVLRSSHGLRRAGSAALDLAYVAAGKLDAYFELGLGPWDLAAGMLLVAEAGGQVSGWPGDQVSPLHTGRVIASNGPLHGWLEDLVGRHVGPL